MKSTGRICLNPSVSNPPPAISKRTYKPCPLKSLSTIELWDLIEQLKYELRNSLFCTLYQIQGMKKRLRDLGEELDARIKFDEYMCSTNPKEFEGKPCKYYWEDGHMVINESLEFYEVELNPPRKALCRVYVKGKRLKAGKKTVYLHRKWSKSRSH